MSIITQCLKKPFMALSIFMTLKNQLCFCHSCLTEFPTSRLEMSAVADIFDRDGDGYIDYYEFVAALHPNKDAYKPLTDADKIEDEVHSPFYVITAYSTSITFFSFVFHLYNLKQ